MSKARVRVEAKRLPHNASKQERDWHLQRLLKIMKRMCDEYGIMHSFKEHQYFIRGCDKRRRKKMAKKLAMGMKWKNDRQGEDW